MRHVSADDFTASAAELTAALQAGDEVVVALGGQDYRLVAHDGSVPDDRTPEQRRHQRAAVDAAWHVGQRMKERYGPTSANEIRGWLEESRP